MLVNQARRLGIEYGNGIDAVVDPAQVLRTKLKAQVIAQRLRQNIAQQRAALAQEGAFHQPPAKRARHHFPG